ncbi:MAG: hypothetical protein JWR67_2090 [Mucilaginibacter sp.]|nr:hypothetical protein [Mucilaginibacter sp.]
MRLPVLISFVGFVVLISATYCPLLRPFHLLNWDVYDLNKPYGISMLLVFVVGIIGTVFNQVKITRLAAWISLLLIVLLYLAAILKVNTTFSFIPFKLVSGYLARQVKFRWGWYLLFAGQLLVLAGVLSNKQKNI